MEKRLIACTYPHSPGSEPNALFASKGPPLSLIACFSRAQVRDLVADAVELPVGFTLDDLARSTLPETDPRAPIEINGFAALACYTFLSALYEAKAALRLTPLPCMGRVCLPQRASCDPPTGFLVFHDPGGTSTLVIVHSRLQAEAALKQHVTWLGGQHLLLSEHLIDHSVLPRTSCARPSELRGHAADALCHALLFADASPHPNVLIVPSH